jgi:hypothetical protein
LAAATSSANAGKKMIVAMEKTQKGAQLLTLE